MKIEDSDNYVLDVWNTIMANIYYIFIIILCFVFVIKSYVFLYTLDDDNTKLLGLIVMVFATIKLITWIPLPHLEFKPRLKDTIVKK